MKKLTLIALLTLITVFAFGCAKKDGEYIPRTQAMDIALEDAGVSKDEAVFVKTEAQWDDGRKVFEIEFFAGDNMEYDYEIDAKSGKIISYDADAEEYVSGNEPSGDTVEEISVDEISPDDAVKIALEEVPGAKETDAHVREDFDDGIKQYDVTIIYEKVKHEFEIDAKSGTILERDSESVYDD